MKVKSTEPNGVTMEFTDEEIKYLRSEAEANNLSLDELYERLFGMLFVGGFPFVAE